MIYNVDLNLIIYSLISYLKVLKFSDNCVARTITFLDKNNVVFLKNIKFILASFSLFNITLFPKSDSVYTPVIYKCKDKYFSYESIGLDIRGLQGILGEEILKQHISHIVENNDVETVAVYSNCKIKAKELNKQNIKIFTFRELVNGIY